MEKGYSRASERARREEEEDSLPPLRSWREWADPEGV